MAMGVYDNKPPSLYINQSLIIENIDTAIKSKISLFDF